MTGFLIGLMFIVGVFFALLDLPFGAVGPWVLALLLAIGAVEKRLRRVCELLENQSAED